MNGAVDEAVAGLGATAAQLGLDGPRRAPEDGEQVEQIEQVGRAVEPLRLPLDLAYVWTTWDLRSFGVLDAIDVTLLDPRTALQEWENLVHPATSLYPSIMLPLTYTQGSSLSIELGTSNDPGGRIFDLNVIADESYLAAEGMAGLIQLLDTAVRRGHDPSHPEADNPYFTVLREATGGLGSIMAPCNRGEWPSHWLEAEGFTEEWLQLRGPTHSIGQFEAERQNGQPLHAVLQGTWRHRAGFGTTDIGTLTDATGSITLAFSMETPRAGFGPGGAVEFEVVSLGEPQAPESPSQPEQEKATVAERVSGRFQRALSFDSAVQVIAIRPVHN
ncbi:MAG: hypothetical protein GY939_19750 [Actinomycetia bacterium]|nr:hypothetical protein [Actinomycetes bacterium]